MAETLLSNPVIENYAVSSRPGVRVRVVTFPGSPRRRRRAARGPHRRPRGRWRCGTATTTSRGVDAVILPGGFSYGDYLRCGAISRFAPVMAEVVEAAVAACRSSASATASRSCASPTCCRVR